MSSRIDTAAYLHLGYGILTLLLGFFVFLILFGSGMISGDVTAIFVTSGVGFFVAIFFLIVSLPSLIAGWGLKQRREWGRVLAFIMSIIDLFSFPIGTAVGGYTLWVLMQPDARAEFS